MFRIRSVGGLKRMFSLAQEYVLYYATLVFAH